MTSARAAVAVVVLLVAVSCAGGIRSTSSAFVDTATNNGNAFGAAPDWTAPLAGGSIIVKSSGGDPGYIRLAGTYYVYSAISDTGNPAAGVASATADLSAISPLQSAVVQTPGSWTIGATAFGFRSPLMTAAPTLPAGTITWSLTSRDAASPANLGTQGFSAIVDNAPPLAGDVQTTNASGGIAGKPEPGDTIRFSANEPLDAQAILSGWMGNATPVIVAIVDGNPDTLQVHDKDATSNNPLVLGLGTVSLGRSDYVSGSSTLSFGQPNLWSTMTRAGNDIDVTLGAVNGTAATTAKTTALTWSPSTLATDRAGNPMSPTPVVETGLPDKEF
jgi:hypothetical protein